MIEEKSSYSSEEVMEICRAYDEIRGHMPKVSWDITGSSDSRLADKLRNAIMRYNAIVPKNVREKLTGLLFE